MTTTEPVTFTNSRGEQLAGRIEKADGGGQRYAIFAHCFTCSKDLNTSRRISQALTDRGINVLRFDFTGLGHSSGTFAETNFSTNVADLVAAAQYLEQNLAPPQLLVGHSLGGAAVLAAADALPTVAAVATIGAPCDPAHVIEMFSGYLEDIEKDGVKTVDLAGRKFAITKQFIADLKAHSAARQKNTPSQGVLILHSPQDEIVPIANARHIYESLRHPKSFISLAGADHLLTKAADSRYAAEVIASWAERYLP